MLVLLLLGYDWVRRLASLREATAFSHGWEILRAEQHLHLRLELVINAWLTGHQHLEDFAAGFYQGTHIPVALTVLAAAYLWRPAAYPRARNALVLTNVVGLIAFALYPTAPPRLLPGAGFFDSVAAVYGVSVAPVSSDQYAALPSLHLAWATWVAVVAGTLVRRRSLRWAMWLYPLMTATVVIATANHYLVDVLAGLALGLAACWVTGALRVRGRSTHVLGWARGATVTLRSHPKGTQHGHAPGARAAPHL